MSKKIVLFESECLSDAAVDNWVSTVIPEGEAHDWAARSYWSKVAHSIKSFVHHLLAQQVVRYDPFTEEHPYMATIRELFSQMDEQARGRAATELAATVDTNPAVIAGALAKQFGKLPKEFQRAFVNTLPAECLPQPKPSRAWPYAD